jgi:hypothetical protein
VTLIAALQRTWYLCRESLSGLTDGRHTVQARTRPLQRPPTRPRRQQGMYLRVERLIAPEEIIEEVLSNDQEPARDGLIENYRTILNELNLLTTVSVLLFGFLLATSDRADSSVEELLYALSLVLVATSTLVFVLPVIYHHIQFPFTNFEKFVDRTHAWMKIGLPMLAGGLYLSLSLAIWSQFDVWSLIIAAAPLVATSIAFLLRRDI